MRLVANLSDNVVLECTQTCGLQQVNWPAGQGPGIKKPGILEARKFGVEACEQTFANWTQRKKIFVLCTNKPSIENLNCACREQQNYDF